MENKNKIIVRSMIQILMDTFTYIRTEGEYLLQCIYGLCKKGYYQKSLTIM